MCNYYPIFPKSRYWLRDLNWEDWVAGYWNSLWIASKSFCSTWSFQAVMSIFSKSWHECSFSFSLVVMPSARYFTQKSKCVILSLSDCSIIFEIKLNIVLRKIGNSVPYIWATAKIYCSYLFKNMTSWLLSNYISIRKIIASTWVIFVHYAFAIAKAKYYSKS